ncbi:5'-methylthioadenosine/adenosylhomocysteine nucleosidase [Barnesiella viscericola]|uniref:5'-methylthioadenosine/adenosylhomocysteine nucleosidase n=1 Tax=Barnesiella viscericola TaxID=397865 RepID=UPI0023530AED|nr:5'-methylthioadenosine/adenosylhomocysteine nucleosidase [Barnesiella viscericola]
MKIGIIVAMQSELDCVRRLLENPREERHGASLFIVGTSGAHELILTQSGIGKVSSAIRAYELIDRYRPDALLNTGVAGGIDPSMRVMDIVVGSEIVYHDVWCGEGNAWGQIQGLPPRFHSDPALVEKALQVETSLRIYKGLVCSGDRFITDPVELAEIKQLFPEGMAVDMESCSIAQVCYMRGVPFLSFRIISDTPGIKGHIAQYNHFWDDAPHRSFEVLTSLIAKL